MHVQFRLDHKEQVNLTDLPINTSFDFMWDSCIMTEL